MDKWMEMSASRTSLSYSGLKYSAAFSLYDLSKKTKKKSYQFNTAVKVAKVGNFLKVYFNLFYLIEQQFTRVSSIWISLKIGFERIFINNYYARRTSQL
jgi:hypothetical protein